MDCGETAFEILSLERPKRLAVLPGVQSRDCFVEYFTDSPSIFEEHVSP